MKRTLTIALLLFVGAQLFATVYTTTTAFILWEDPTSWVDGVVPPEPIPPGDVVVIRGFCSHGPGTVTNDGTLIVAASATLYFFNTSSAGVDFINNSLLIVDGNFYTSNANFAGITNYNANYGMIDLNGYWENTGPFDNFGDVYLQKDGDFRNYDVSFSSGLIICNIGTLNNSGNFYLNGGTRTADYCGGGAWTGNAELNGSCQAPPAVVAYVNTFGDLTFRWVRAKDDFGYKVGATDVASGTRRLTDVPADAKEFTIPAGGFPTGLTLQYGAMTYCTAGLVDLANLTLSSSTLDTRKGQTMSNLSIYPNPAKDFLKIEGLRSSGDILIHTTTGQLLTQQRFDEATVLVDLKDLPKGLLLISLRDANSSETLQFIHN